MTKDEVVQRIIKAAHEALSCSEAFSAACARLEEVGFERRIAIGISLFELDTVASPAVTTDADFLRMLRIQPDLEAR